MTVRVSTLPSGLRVVTARMPGVETVSFGAWVGVGTRDEAPEINGISHLLEHMAFKGTERRNAQQIAEEVEAVGGHINAYTAREHTAYYVKVLKDDVDLAVDIVADILQHSVMDADELAREQDVVCQEINQAFDTPDDIIFDHFQETAYPGQALGRPVLGTAEKVRAVDSPGLRAYMRERYGAANMVVAAVGNLDHDALARRVADAFGGLGEPANGAREPARYVGGDYREARDVEQVHLILGLDGVSYDDPDFHAAGVFSTLFGGGMSSRLFQEVREKRGLAYSIYSYMSNYTDGGLLAVYAGTGPEQSKTLVGIVVDELAKLTGAIPADEVARARQQVKASLLMSLESTSSRAEQLARQMLVYGRPIPTEETVDRIEAVDAARLNRVAERLLESRPTLAALGPAKGVEGLAAAAGK